MWHGSGNTYAGVEHGHGVARCMPGLPIGAHDISTGTIHIHQSRGVTMWVAEYHNDGSEIITTYDPQHQDGLREWYHALLVTGEIRGYQIGDE